MVAQIAETRTSDRWYRVTVDGREVGAIELDATQWAAHAANRPVRWFRSREAARGYILAVAADQADPMQARWERALARAIAAGIDPVRVGGLESTWAVPSATRLDSCYLVTSGEDGAAAADCTCTAASHGDAVCLHRAAVRACLGILALPEPAGEDAAPAAAPAQCRSCNGRGWVWGDWPGEGGTQCRCLVCLGTGTPIAAA